MTKNEALELEKKCEGYINDITNSYFQVDDTKCKIGLTLSNCLRVYIGDNYFCFDTDYSSVKWFYYEGYWSDAEDYKNVIMFALRKNSEDFDQLIWSYNHRSELTE